MGEGYVVILAMNTRRTAVSGIPLVLSVDVAAENQHRLHRDPKSLRDAVLRGPKPTLGKQQDKPVRLDAYRGA